MASVDKVSIVPIPRRDTSPSNSTTTTNILVDDDEFTPKESNGIVGDIVFHIRADGMSVASSSLDAPCQPNGAGVRFWSSELSEGDTFTVSNVTAADTILIYNPKEKNCADGYVGIINPTDSLTLSSFKDAAEAYDKASIPPAGAAFGGVVGGQATPEQKEPFFMKHLGTIIGVIIALFLAIVIFAGFFCWKAKRRVARCRAEEQLQQQQLQGMYGNGGGYGGPGAYPEGGYEEDEEVGGKYRR